MNQQEFIASGILESYVLGLATPAEQAEVAQMAADYPEVRRELEALQSSLAGYATLHTVRPPADLKQQILDGIKGVPQEEAGDFSTSTAGSGTTDRVRTAKKPKAPRPKLNKTAVAYGVAALAALLALILGALMLYAFSQKSASADQVGSLETELTEQRTAYATLEENCNETSQELEALRSRLELLQSPGTSPVRLAPLRGRKRPVQAVVYWNKEQNIGLINPIGLPDITNEQTYQLWGETSRGLVSLGTFNNLPATLQEVEFNDGAVNLYVSVEKAGGSVRPTMSQVKLLGKI